MVGAPARARAVKVETALGVGRTKVRMGQAGMGAAEIDLVEVQVTMRTGPGMEAKRAIGRASSLRGASESLFCLSAYLRWSRLAHVDAVKGRCMGRTWPCDV